MQRAASARVTVEDEVVGQLTRPGLVILLGVGHDDTQQVADRLAAKIWGLRILTDELSASDLNAPILVVSQFTLYADTKKGRRPSWYGAAPSEISEPMVEYFISALTRLGAEVSQGRFGADMKVELVNDGPVTIVIDTDTWR